MASHVKRSDLSSWALASLCWFIVMLGGSLAEAQEMPALPASIGGVECWASGDTAVGTAEKLSPEDGAADTEVETFVLGNLDISALPPGAHRIPVRVKDAAGNESEIFWMDVVVYESSWRPNQKSQDTDFDGLPDQWEKEHFGGMDMLAEHDPDQDGLSNLEELRLGTDPMDGHSPSNRVLRAEAFINNDDPGEGEAYPLTAVDGLLDSEVEDLELPDYLTRYLTPGNHTVGVRVQRETGEWSEVRNLDLVVFEDEDPVAPEDFGIVEAEGFWEDNISPSSGTELALQSVLGDHDARDTELVASLGSLGQEPGINRLFYRFKSAQTGYGLAQENHLQIQDPDPQVVDVPFYVDSLFDVPDHAGIGSELFDTTFNLRNPWWYGDSNFPMPMLGWIGTGDVSAYGAGNHLDINLQTGGTLTWLWGKATFAVTFNDDYGVGTGKGMLSRYGTVTSSVPSLVYLSSNTRMRCIGWAATGSAPASGISNSVSYRLTGDTTIHWQWVRQHRVAIESRHGSVDGWEEWYDEESMTQLTPRADAGYEFESWAGALSGELIPGVVAVSAPITVVAQFKPTQSVELTVVEVDGTKSVKQYTKGEILDISPEVLKAENGNTRDVPTAWRVEGAIYDHGQGVSVTVALTRDTTLYWLPTRQYRIVPTIVPVGGGTVRVEGNQSTSDADWYDAGPIRIIAKHAEGHRFADWYLQKWSDDEVHTILSAELPLVARFAKVEPLGDYVAIDGGSLSSPNSAVSHYRSFIPSAKLKRTEVTTSEYCTYLNWTLQAGYLETPNHISVKGANPLSEYSEGLLAEWFHGADWTAEPEFVNTVSSLNLDFGIGFPAQITNGTPNCPFTESDYFSFRLRGQIYSTHTGKISFKEFCDDKVKIIFRGVEVLDNADPNSNAAIQVDAVEGWNDIEFVFIEETALAKFKVQWDPTGSTAWQDVPASVLQYRNLNGTWAGHVAEFDAPEFQAGLELVDLDTVDCNIEIVNGVYQPKVGQENMPLVDVTWHGANAYCRWMAEATGQPITLPDEWLWEYAASGGNSNVAGFYYPWGPRFLGTTYNHANYAGSQAGTLDVYNGLSPVGTFPSYHGLLDMAGNVFEWTSTRYEQGDPQDPFMVTRGGSWNQPNTLMATSYRLIYKNQFFSDKATGFRPALVNEVEFAEVGYIEVPLDPTVESPNSTRADYEAPAERYLMSALETTNADYVRFLNTALIEESVLIQGDWVVGNASGTHAGKQLIKMAGNTGIELRDNVFVAVPGHQLEPVVWVTWYGADAYCSFLSVSNPSVRYSLPNQWQWENAMIRGLESLDRDQVNYVLAEKGLDRVGNLGTDVRYGLGFWPGFYDAAGNVQEWTSSPPSPDLLDRAILRGGAYNLEDLFTLLTKADQHAERDDARAYMGFRPSITAMAPKVEGLFEKVVVPVSGAERKLAFVAHSFLQAPQWVIQKVSGPSWVALSDLGSGRCHLTVTPPATPEDSTVSVSVSDGTMETTFDLDVSVVSNGGFQLDGIPEVVNIRGGGEAQTYFVRALPVGLAGDSVTWGVAGAEGHVVVESAGPLGCRLTITAPTDELSNITLTASDGTYEGRAAVSIVNDTPEIEFVDFPETVLFDDSRTNIRVPLEVKGGAVGDATSWSVASEVSSWARIVSQNGSAAILEIDRAGFDSSGGVVVTYSDGINQLSGSVNVVESRSAPRILLPAGSMQFVAGLQGARVLVTAEDRNAGDSLQWTVESSNGAVSITPVNGRSAELQIDTRVPFAEAPVTIRVSDGTETASAVIHIGVHNADPVIVGAEGVVEFEVGAGPYELSFEAIDSDRGQHPQIRVVGSDSWYSSHPNGQSSLCVTIPGDSSSVGSLTIEATDGITVVSRVIQVKVKPINGTPDIEGLPPKLHLARYAEPVRMPFTLTDNDTVDQLSVGLVFDVPGVNILMTGERRGQLMIDPIQTEEALPVLLEVTDGKEKTRFLLQLTLGELTPDGHQIAMAEYFVDVEPAPGAGTPVPASNNEPFNDTATFARLDSISSSLDPGWHKIGVRFKTVAGQWSDTRWLDVHVFEDAPREGIAYVRPDGSLTHSRWASTPAIDGQARNVPNWADVFEDTHPDQSTGTDENLVFEDIDGVEHIESAIVWAEYYVDHDPGEGNAIRLPIDRSGLDSTLSHLLFDLDTSHLSVGEHTIGLRCHNAAEEWGETMQLTFFVFEDTEPEIAPKVEVVDVEYIWDGAGSPGFGYGLPLDSSNLGSEIGSLNALPVQTASLDTGDHDLFVRFKNDGGDWGEPRSWGITVAAPDSSLDLVNLHVESNIGIPFLNFDSDQLLGSTIYLHVPQIYWVDGLVYANFGFIGQGSVPAYGENNSVNFTIGEASDLTWIWGRDCEVTSRSAFAPVAGTGTWQWYEGFNTGYGVFAPLEQVILSVPETVNVASGIRQHCIGWTGIGSAPASGDTYQVSFTALEQNTEVNWVWQKEYELAIEVQGEGQVFGNDVWVAENMTENVSAVPNEGHRFVRWESDLVGSETEKSIVMNAPKTVRAIFSEHKVWTVNPVTGERELAGVYEDGAEVAIESPQFFDVAAGSRYVVTGWAGAGSASSGGGGTTATFIITEDSEIRWSGVKQHWVNQRSNNISLGSIVVLGAREVNEGSWFDEGIITLDVEPSEGAVFVRWLGDVEGASAKFNYHLNKPIDTDAVFRSVVNPPNLVDVPSGVLKSSLHVDVPGFQSDIQGFGIAATETTNKLMVEALNHALAEKSIQVHGDRVIGRKELVAASPGLIESWFDSSDVLLTKDVVVNLDDHFVSKPEGFSEASHSVLSGRLYLEAVAQPGGLWLEGAGKVSVSWDGQVLANDVGLPTWLPITGAMGWGDLRIEYSPDVTDSVMSVELTDSEGSVLTSMSGGIIQHYDDGGTEPLQLAKGNIGATANQANDFETVLVTDGVVIPDTGDNYWFKECSSDFGLKANIARPSSGVGGLMVRHGLKSDSPCVELGVSSEGLLVVNGVSHLNSKRESWTVRIGRRGAVVITEYLDFDGKWKDAVTGTLELSAHVLFEDLIGIPSVIGLFTDSGDLSASQLQFVDLSRPYNRQGQVLLDMGWPGGEISYDGSMFAVDPSVEDLPVTCISHDGAIQYAEWLEDRLQDGDYSLPNEWEFEYVSGGRTGDSYAWPAVENSVNYANLAGPEPGFSQEALAPVGSFTATNGIYDLLGNVWEWTSSDHLSGHGAWKNIRGASYRQPVESSSSSFRLFYGRQSFVSREVGFRVVRKDYKLSTLGRVLDGANLNLITPSEGLVRGFISPVKEYAMASLEVSNSDFSSFLNAMQIGGKIEVIDGWVTSKDPTFHFGQRLLRLSGHQGIEENNGAYTVVAGMERMPVTSVSWHGADGFCRWMTTLSADWDFRLPTEWEWETASQSGMAGISSLLPSVDLANEDGSGALSFTVGGPAWGIHGMVSSVAEWTSSTVNGESDLIVIKGGVEHWYSGDRLVSDRVEYLSADSVSPSVGFRIVRVIKEESKTTSSNGDWDAAIDPGVLAEGGRGELILTRRGDPVFEYEMTLTVNDPRVLLPSSVTFAPGESVRVVAFDVAADMISQGDQMVTIQINSENLSNASLAVLVTDKSIPDLSMSVVQGELKSGETVTLRINHNGNRSNPLLVRMSSDSILGVPEMLTIPAGDTYIDYQISLPHTEVITSYQLDASADWHRSGQVVIDVEPGTSRRAYDVWTEAAGLVDPDNAPDATPMKDGVSNLLKFAFNLDGSQKDLRYLRYDLGDVTGLPATKLIKSGQDEVLSIEYIRRKASSTPGITYVVQFGSTLDDWAMSTTSENVTPIDDVWERVVVSDAIPSSGSRRFGRVKVVMDSE